MKKRILNELVYFGKPGSFTHLVAKRIGKNRRLVSKETVAEVLHYVQAAASREGIVPIENSSGGMILDTIDGLVAKTNTLSIRDEYSLNVKLNLMACSSGKITRIYSHFVPFHHCHQWLKLNYPEASQIIVQSTSEAAELASRERGAAAISQKSSAKKYGLKILHQNIGDHAHNLTQFYLLSHCEKPSVQAIETSLSVVLKNKTGSLYQFLGIFAKNRVNLKRIMSRPLAGTPNGYLFFLSVEASSGDRKMIKSLKEAAKMGAQIRLLGSYPVHRSFES